MLLYPHSIKSVHTPGIPTPRNPKLAKLLKSTHITPFPLALCPLLLAVPILAFTLLFYYFFAILLTPILYHRPPDRLSILSGRPNLPKNLGFCREIVMSRDFKLGTYALNLRLNCRNLLAQFFNEK